MQSHHVSNPICVYTRNVISSKVFYGSINYTYDFTISEYEPKKLVQFAEEVEVKSIETEPEIVEIDEAKIDAYVHNINSLQKNICSSFINRRLISNLFAHNFFSVLHMLHEADPTGEVADPPELAALEGKNKFQT